MLKKRLIATENRFQSGVCQAAKEMPHLGVTVRYQEALDRSLNMVIFGVY